MIKTYLKKAIKEYISSFKDIKLLGRVFIFDALFAIFASMGFFISASMLNTSLKKLAAINMNMAAKSLAELQSIAAALRGFFAIGAVSLLVFILFLIIGYSIFEGKAWCAILKKRFSLQYLKKFTLLNLVWFFSFIAIVALLLIGSKKSIAAIALLIAILLFLYLTPILSFSFTIENRLSSIREAFKIGFAKLHLLLLPLLLIFATAFIASKLAIVYSALPPSLTLPFNILISILLFSWAKVYVSGVIQNSKLL